MYASVLFVHSWLRWAVLLLAIGAIVRALAGSRLRRPWNAKDERVARLFIIALDVQVLLGLLLYFALSPITSAALGDFGTAMAVSAMRFWAVEHVFGMFVGVALAHRGLTRARRVADPIGKHRVLAIFFILAVLVILVSLPWPGTPNARPLFRW